MAWIQASLALFAYPAVTSGEEGCDLAFLNTLLTGRVRAREGRQRTTTSSPLSPGSSASIKGEKHGRFLSLRCHIINSGVSGMIAVFMQVEVTESRICELNRGWRITLYRGWTPPCEWREGGTTEDYRRHHTQRHNLGSNTWVVSRHNIPSWTPWGQGITLYWGPVGHYK